MTKALNPKLLKGKYRLELPVAEANPEAVRSFMRECLVPLLAKEFLARQGTTSPTPTKVKTHKRTFKPLGEEGGPEGGRHEDH